MSARLSLGRRLKRTRANGTTSAAADYAKGLYNEVVEELDGADIPEDQQLDIFEDWNSVSFHPQTVANAFNKLARAQSATFHAVALDKMPDEDGNEVPATMEVESQGRKENKGKTIKREVPAHLAIVAGAPRERKTKEQIAADKAAAAEADAEGSEDAEAEVAEVA